MLARRFTIVCLLVALFGMVFASLAAESAHRPRSPLVRVPAPFSGA